MLLKIFFLCDISFGTERVKTSHIHNLLKLQILDNALNQDPCPFTHLQSFNLKQSMNTGGNRCC